MTIPAEGWFLYAAGPDDTKGAPARLRRESYTLGDTGDDEILVAPLYGSFEANMGHALMREPIDICAARGYDKAVIGNAGTGRIVEIGRNVSKEHGLEEGQRVCFFGMDADPWGYPKKLMGFDSRITGIMTTRIKLRPDCVIPIPAASDHHLSRWAAFNVRYMTAWSNWRLAYGMFRLQLDEEEFPRLNVWTWGGGTGLAEVHLAKLLGHNAVAFASKPERLALVESLGVEAIDRTPFTALQFDGRRYGKDEAWTAEYVAAEEAFVQLVRERTEGQGVQIFVDLIGPPVFRATVKALGRQGVVTTAGWKAGMKLWYHRAVECIGRHQFVHTHFCRRREAEDAMAFAVEHEWLPDVDDPIASFDEIPELAERYLAGEFRMFPCYQVNPE